MQPFLPSSLTHSEKFNQWGNVILSCGNIYTIEAAGDKYIFPFLFIFFLHFTIPPLEFIIRSINISFSACFCINKLYKSKPGNIIFLFIFKNDANKVVLFTDDP